jgi:hypothetical protein
LPLVMFLLPCCSPCCWPWWCFCSPSATATNAAAAPPASPAVAPGDVSAPWLLLPLLDYCCSVGLIDSHIIATVNLST